MEKVLVKIGKRPGNNRKKAGNNWKKAWRQKLFLRPRERARGQKSDMVYFSLFSKNVKPTDEKPRHRRKPFCQRQSKPLHRYSSLVIAYVELFCAHIFPRDDKKIT